MTCFLVYTDDLGVVVEIRLSEPPFLISRLNVPVTEIFRNDEGIKIKEMLAQTSGTNIDDLPVFKLKDEGLSVRLHVIKTGKRKMLFGLDDESFLQIKENEVTKKLLRCLLSAFNSSSADIQMIDKEMVQMNFEQIQLLNSKLMNTERALQKERSKLELLNRELNNRLVKDALTGLVSRYQYRAEIEHSIASCPNSKGVFVFIDIDDFKRVNDTYGHAVGDKYLIEFARRLESIPIENSVKMRISGDEFGLYLHGNENPDAAFMKKIWGSIKKHVLYGPIVTESGDIPIEVSAGMAIYGKDTKEVYDLIEYADFAMYNAKRSGKNRYEVFDAAEYQKSKLNLQQ